MLSIKGVQALTEHALMMQDQGLTAGETESWATNDQENTFFRNPDESEDLANEELTQVAELTERYLLNVTKN